MHGRAIEVDGSGCIAFLLHGDKRALNIIRTYLANLITVERFFPEGNASLIIRLLLIGDLCGLLQPDPIIRPCIETVPLRKHIQATAQLEPDGRLLLLQLCR